MDILFPVLVMPAIYYLVRCSFFFFCGGGGSFASAQKDPPPPTPPFSPKRAHYDASLFKYKITKILAKYIKNVWCYALYKIMQCRFFCEDDKRCILVSA